MGIFNFVKAGGKKFGSIVGVGAKVNKTKLDEATSKLNILKHKTKMSKSKLDKTLSDIDQASKTRIERKFGGGADMGKKNSNVAKINKTFGPKKKLSPKQMKIAKLAGNPNKIDGADFKKLRGKA